MHISDAIVVALIASIPGILSALLMGLKNHGAIEDVRISLDGRLHELVEASIDKGKIQERTEQRAIIASSIAESTKVIDPKKE